jgi:hypothetical protein
MVILLKPPCIGTSLSQITLKEPSWLHSNKVNQKKAVPNLVLSKLTNDEEYPVTFFVSINLSPGFDFATTPKIYVAF